MNIGMIRINRRPFLADDALLYFLGQATSSSALRERLVRHPIGDIRYTSGKCQKRSFVVSITANFLMQAMIEAVPPTPQIDCGAGAA
jgi:hypothetical protein